MTARRWAALCIVLTLGGCASGPKMVMVNPHSGATVDCELPDSGGSSADYLVSRMCLSACQAHGFRPMPGVQALGNGADVPQPCLN
ncbi:hypothetical protein [Acidisphaera sp. L21]|jgi:hypothetical protein|uniref:hypothetical protein n=1 Tax=Acidisphaera sp. L21 TaxID=1641851 RepID=UPI00131DF44B|nr:hypothetical protein [Acidisphaera sp. L21]